LEGQLARAREGAGALDGEPGRQKSGCEGVLSDFSERIGWVRTWTRHARLPACLPTSVDHPANLELALPAGLSSVDWVPLGRPSAMCSIEPSSAGSSGKMLIENLIDIAF
jgi:hypothetical protein